MNLIKTSESVRRSFDEQGKANEVVDSIDYKVVDGEEVIGTANVYVGGYSLNIHRASASVEELKSELENMLNNE